MYSINKHPLPPNQPLHPTGAARTVFRSTKVSPAAPAGELLRSAAEVRGKDEVGEFWGDDTRRRAMTPVCADGAEWLLVIHLIGGASALLAALVAFSAKAWNVAHRWHVYSGRFFFWSMVLVIATALPLAIRASNMFLLLIGLFSFYLAWSGWRYAMRRRAAPYRLDRVAAALMAATSLAMIGYGVAMLVRGDYLGVALIVFGAIGGSLCAADLRGKQGDERARIASHLTRMLAATIATLTAFLVTNVKVEPALVIWLLPTIVMTPVIALWNRRIMSGYRPQGMPSGDPGARQS